MAAESDRALGLWRIAAIEHKPLPHKHSELLGSRGDLPDEGGWYQAVKWTIEKLVF